MATQRRSSYNVDEIMAYTKTKPKELKREFTMIRHRPAYKTYKLSIVEEERLASPDVPGRTGVEEELVGNSYGEIVIA